MNQRKLAKSICLHALPLEIARVGTRLVWRKDVLYYPARSAFADGLAQAADQLRAAA